MKTPKSSVPKEITRQWVEIDLSARPLGRVATEIANILRGKNKRTYMPHIDGGDFVVAINADKLKFTGRKLEQKKYHSYTGYPGGLRTKVLKDIIVTRPEFVVRQAVFNMLDDNKIRKTALRRLKIVKGSEHKFKIDKKA